MVRILVGRVLGGVVLAGLFSMSIVPAASSSGVANGLRWLFENQDPSGLWGSQGATPFRDATVVVEALGAIVPLSSSISAAMTAINATPTASTDYLARRILANAAADTGADLSSLATDLAGRQNTDGGWAYSRRYASNRLETALALRALKSAGYSNLTVLGAGVSHLTARQNPDFGWGFAAGDPSQVFHTAHVLMALQALRADFNVSTAIQNGVAWLKTQDHADGGFGTGLASNTYETALAVLVLAVEDSMALEVTGGRDYLESTQLADGSWNGDAYSTALAILALPRETFPVAVGPVAPVELQFSVVPNPSRDAATVVLALPRPDRVTVAVYDLSGRLVRMLADGHVAAGAQKLSWNMRSESGSPVPSGTYYVRFRYGAETRTRKIVVTR